MSCPSQLKRRLFGRRFVINTLTKSLRCPKCRANFQNSFVRKPGTFVKSCRPFLLPCGHNMCENCVVENRNNLTCSVCLRPVVIAGLSEALESMPACKVNVRQYFDLNFYLIGELHHLRYFYNGSPGNSLVLSGNTSSCTGGEYNVILCGECDRSPAKGFCDQCNAHFCHMCFRKVHVHSKVLKWHTMEKIVRPDFIAFVPKYCRQHRCKCDIYCEQCAVSVCAGCAKMDHNRHQLKRFTDKNSTPSASSSFENFLATVTSMRDDLRKSYKAVQAIESFMEDNAAQFVDSVSNYFLDLHTFLQLEEKRINEYFYAKSLGPQRVIRNTLSQLDSSLHVVNDMIKNLIGYQRVPASDVLLDDIIVSYMQQLHPHYLDVQASKVEQKPYSFKILRDLRNEFSQYYNVEYIDPRLSIHIASVYVPPQRPSPANDGSDPHSSMDMEVSYVFHESAKHTYNKFGNKVKPPGRNTSCSHKSTKRNYSGQSVRCTKKAIRADNDDAQPLDEEPTDPIEFSSNPMESSETVTDNAVATFNPPAVAASRGALLKALISHVQTPEHFYVHQWDTPHRMRVLSERYVMSMQFSTVPLELVEGDCYMTYNKRDQMWYRALLRSTLPDDRYDIFLVDIGLKQEVAKHELCQLDPESVKVKVPYAAIRCALHGLQPAGEHWDEEATRLLIEMTHNDPVQVSIVATINEHFKLVDLFTTHSGTALSLRDAFLFTGVARERSDSVIKSHVKISPVARNQRQTTYSLNQMYMVQVLHIENPHEFYVVELHKVTEMDRMWRTLNAAYKSEPDTKQPLFWAPVGQWCIVFTDHVYHRAAIEDQKTADGPGHIGVRLIDSGRRVVVFWRQLFALQAQFAQDDAFATRCQLANVVPLRAHNYVWQEAGVREFVQIVSNPLLQMTVLQPAKQANQSHSVVLHVNRRNADLDVAHVLSRHCHCEWVGTPVADRKVALVPSPLSASPARCDTPPSGRIKLLKRTEVALAHIVHPGELYIQIQSLLKGIQCFHARLQKAGAEAAEAIHAGTAVPKKEWFVGDHCLAHVEACDSFGLSNVVAAKRPQKWVRGVIISIDYDVDPDCPFALFLRDVGATVRGIGAAQLFEIDNEWDRVADAVTRCHLACIGPTGGTNIWSQSAIEYFKHMVELFAQMSVTLLGSRDEDTNSLPVVLWGATLDTQDPLAPTVFKYSNVNRMLVKAGLVHLVQRMDMSQMERLVQQERREGQITMAEWFSTLEQNALLNAIQRAEQKFVGEANLNNSDAGDAGDSQPLGGEYDAYEEQLGDLSMTPTTPETPAPFAWLKSLPIEKTLFTGCATYVDHSGNIYLHDMQHADLLVRMRSLIMAAYAKVPNEPDFAYGPGQACLVRYHLDGLLYRGLVQPLNGKAEYDVYFIDYGNTESVGPNELLPFAPFVEMPAIACQFRIANVVPKLCGGQRAYRLSELDAIHSLVVGKVLSMRVQMDDQQQAITACEMSIGGVDLGEVLLREGYAERAQPPAVPHVSFRSSGVNQDFTIDDGFDTTPQGPKEMQPSTGCVKKQPLVPDDEHNSSDLITFIDVDGCEDSKEYLDYIPTTPPPPPPPEGGNKSQLQLPFQMSPSRPLRIFEPSEYLTMPNRAEWDMQQALKSFQATFNKSALSSGPELNNAIKDTNISFEFDDDADIIELEQSFALRYWHNETAAEPIPSTSQNPPQKNEEAVPKKETPTEGSSLSLYKLSEDELSKTEETSSYTDRFIPVETSSVFTHYSGIERIKQGNLPIGLASFRCSVELIESSTVLQILPNLFDNEFREVELQRRIDHLVPDCAPLKHFELATVCLASYSVDRKWYRALIRSYNPAAKTVDVFYADYLNMETLPIAALRECPRQLLDYPRRTVTARLYGIKPNARLRDRDLCRELMVLCAKRMLVAKIKARSDNNNESQAAECCEIQDALYEWPGRKSDDVEIELFESEEATLPIYQSLIEKNYYKRT